MRPRSFLAAVVLLALVGLAAPGVAVEIAGPEQIAPYKLIDHSLPNSALWEIEPADQVDMRQAEDGKSITWVAPPGRYKIMAIIVLIDFDKRSWSIQKASKEVVIGNPPIPPGPDPQPIPGAKQVMFFFDRESLDNLPPAQQALLASLTVRQTLEARGHRFLGAFDPATTGPDGNVPAERAAWWKAVQNKKLPRVAVAPIGGGEIVDYDLPADEAALLDLLDGGS